ncbi:MAG TPA: sigma-70 family RNA polymerase sigma factor [Planctomycetota bacterium]|nr:sigma-70 family RNA polymerase sigma factor [Planctomycetota bacterium]
METPCDAAPPDLEVALADDRFVRALARRLARGVDPDDLAQDAWLAALRRRPDRPGLRGWMTRAIAHLAVDRSRERDRRARREERAARSEVAPEAALVEREEVRKRVVAAVLALGRPASTVLTLRYFEDLSPRDIARRLAMPPATVRSHLKRGLAKLRDRLAGDRDARGRPTLALLPLLFTPRDAFAAALGAVLMSAKGKTAAAVVVAACVIGAGAAMTAEGPPRASFASESDASSPSPREASEADRANRPTSPAPVATVAAEPFRDETSHAASAPAIDAASCVVRGRVLDADGRPAAGCTVAALSREACGLDHFDETGALERLCDGKPQFDSCATTTVADAEGRFTFEKLARSMNATVVAADVRFGLASIAALELGEGSALDLELQFAPATVLHGVVSGPSGEPLAGETVHVSRMRPRRAGMVLGGLTVRTDARGRYRTAPLPVETADLRTHRNGCYAASASVVNLPPREVRVDLRLMRAPRLQGRLLAPDGGPVRLEAWRSERREGEGDELLEVLGSTLDPRASPEIRFDDDACWGWGGVSYRSDSWSLQPVSPSTYVSVWAGGRLLGCDLIDDRETFDLVVDPAALPPRRRPGAVRIRVVDENGRAITDAHVVLRARRPGGGTGPGGEKSCDPDGVCLFERALPGDYLALASAPGRSNGLAELTLADGGSAQTSLVLRPIEGAIALQVLGPDGPVRAYARVHDAAGRPLPDAFTAYGNRDGRLRIDGLSAGTHVVTLAAARLAPVATRVDVRRDAPPTPVRMRPGVEVEVRVVGVRCPVQYRYFDAFGTPLRDDVASGARIPGDGERFRLEPGPAAVEVHAPGFETGRTDFEAREGAVVTVQMRRKT